MKIYYYIILLCIFFISCSKDNDEDSSNSIINRTIIVYMAADNDLYQDALTDIKEMKQGFLKRGANLIVFIDPLNELPALLEIKPNGETLVKSYPELDSTNPEVLKNVIQEIVTRYPANELGLILWSHGTSWLPAGSRLRSFGSDNGNQMNITDLARNLPVKFNFILFDACLMGSAEVAYELREKTDYIIASSTETIYEGFPYDKIIPELIQPVVDLRAVAQGYFSFYNTLQGAYRSASITVIDAKPLTGLAGEMKKMIEENNINPLFDRKSVQRLDVYDEQYVFDLADFVTNIFPNANTQSFINYLNQSILYKNSTPMFLSMYELKTYCGMSCYIHCSDRNDLNAYYTTLQWYKDTGMNKLLNDMPMIE